MTAPWDTQEEPMSLSSPMGRAPFEPAGAIPTCETGNPVRYYLPFADVDLGLLTRGDTVSECPYKGDGQHWHLDVCGEHLPGAAWSCRTRCPRPSRPPSTSASTRPRCTPRPAAAASPNNGRDSCCLRKGVNHG